MIGGTRPAVLNTPGDGRGYRVVSLGGGRTLEATAAFLSIVFILLHSSVDYPLRTMAIAVTFALLNGIYFHRLPLFKPLSRDEAIEVRHNGDTILVPIERPKGFELIVGLQKRLPPIREG